MITQGFTKFELAMGLALIAIVALVMFPPLHGGVEKDQSIRAWSKAESIAYAILDYHEDTGKWPAIGQGTMDLSCLTRPMSGSGAEDPSRSPQNPQAMALMGANGMNGLPGFEEPTEEPWIEEVPLDAWDRPFTVRILDIPNGSGARALVVLSAGPDGVLETDPATWPLERMAAAEAGHPINPGEQPERLTIGDDIACMMTLAGSGGV